jgi:hypothetical protein
MGKGARCALGLTHRPIDNIAPGDAKLTALPGQKI